jgi:hypothetical protein
MRSECTESRSVMVGSPASYELSRMELLNEFFSKSYLKSHSYFVVIPCEFKFLKSQEMYHLYALYLKFVDTHPVMFLYLKKD